MPNTCDRLVDGTIAAVVMKATCAYMHPSQVVMNCFKEPQHAVHAIQALLDSNTPVAALLVDLSKAFERVNPYWDLTYPANAQRTNMGYVIMPNTSYLEGSSAIKFKADFCRLERCMWGVDMGRSFSVFPILFGNGPDISLYESYPPGH